MLTEGLNKGKKEYKVVFLPDSIAAGHTNRIINSRIKFFRKKRAARKSFHDYYK